MTKEEALKWFDNTRDLSKQSKHKVKLTELLTDTSYLPEKSSLPQRLWHIINSTTEIPGCKTCGSSVSWDRRFKRYKTFCGNPRCPNIDPDVVERKTKKVDFGAAKRKRQLTNLDRYGHTNYLASSVGKEDAKKGWEKSRSRSPDVIASNLRKRTTTMQHRYGVDNFSHTLLKPQTITCLQDKDWMHAQHYIEKKSLSHIAHELCVAGGATTIGQYLRKHGLTTQTLPAQSHGEKMIAKYLASLDITVVQCDRTVIKPQELDIYLPEHNLAIEYCGLYWHSEQKGKDRNYHKQKMEKCKAHGIQLLTIFEDEWITRQKQVKRKLASLLRISNERSVYARKCHIVNMTTKQKVKFFEENHIQGSGPGSITHGLAYDNEIVAAMTWIKQSNAQYTLNRYATSCRVPGGFSKLLTHFKKTYTWKTLVSFADLRWSDGNLYYQTGWHHDSTLRPDYYYSPDGHQRFHKFNYRRQNLSKLLTHFDPHLSETENCKNNGILRIWDCGKLRFIIEK